jgi:metallo-beta-lactamase class B
VVFAVSLTTAVNAEARPTNRNWNNPVAPFRIAGNLYYVGASDLASYLIVTPQGNILLDGGMEETAPQIERNIQTLGFKLKEVKFLLNSHAHFDHAAGLLELKRLSGARLVASRADAKALEEGDENDFTWGDTVKFKPVKVDQIIADGGTLSLGGTTLTAHLTPGHTRGCTTWTMPVHDAGKTYNVVFIGSVTAPGYRLVNNTKYPGIVADYEHSFQVLRSLPCDIFLASHGSVFDLAEKRERLKAGGPNPFIAPEEYRSFVERSWRDFEAELSKQRNARHQT